MFAPTLETSKKPTFIAKFKEKIKRKHIIIGYVITVTFITGGIYAWKQYKSSYTPMLNCIVIVSQQKICRS